LSSATLVVQTAFLGDVVLTTPLFSALAADHGPVDVVTTPIAAPLIETHPAVRKVIPYDKRGNDRGWAGLRNLARRLRTERYERAYLPHRSLRTATLGVLAGIPARIGFSGAWSFLYTEARPKPALGHESDEQAATALIDGAFVVLAPGSIWGSKRWPYYGELAAKLAASMPVVLVGGPDDAGLGEEIVKAVGRSGGRAVNACGKLTLRQSAALIGRASALVTNDSAPLHLATAMGTPIVALFGPTVTEFGFGPLRPGDVALGIDELPCRPCSSHGPPQCPLGHHRCMRELTVAAVIAAIEELVALRRRG